MSTEGDRGLGIKKWLTGPGRKGGTAKAKTSGVPARDQHRIAVLPFVNMSPDSNDSYFADGMTEEIISTLSGVSGLSVIARTSVMGYKGTTKKLKDIANELEAGSILEGSFRKAANKIRVTTQLIDINSDKHVWAQSYDRNLDDVFSVQTDIARQVVEALRVKISTPEIDRIDKKPTENTEAYSLYLRGRYHLNKRGLKDIEKAAEWFARAVQEDTTYALGYVGLADCHELLTTNFGIDVTTNHQKAGTEVARALELDGNLGEAHATSGLVLHHDFNLGRAEEEYRKAIALKPSYAPAHLWYFQLLRAELRWDEALSHIQKAVEYDPFSQIINLNHGLFYASIGDYAKALELDQKAAELDPNYAWAHVHLFHVYGRMKRFEDAKHEAKTVAELIRESFPMETKVLEAETAYFEEDKADVRRLLPELEAHIGESPDCQAWRIAGLHFYLGQNDKGFEWLERSYSRKELRLTWIKSSDFFDQIRSDPRYQSLLNRIGLAQHTSFPAQHTFFSE